MILQVDRVASVEEAVAFRDVGATLVGVALDPDQRFQDARLVSSEVALAIRKAIAPAQLVGIVPPFFAGGSVAQSRNQLERILALKPDFIQLYRDEIPRELDPIIHAAGIPVITDGLFMSDNDHPLVDLEHSVPLFLSQTRNRTGLTSILLHAEVAATMMHPWEFLTGEALKWPEECLQVEDVAAATHASPLLLSLMGVRPTEIGPYVGAFPDARGFYATLGQGYVRGSRTSKSESVLAALRVLQLGTSSTYVEV